MKDLIEAVFGQGWTFWWEGAGTASLEDDFVDRDPAKSPRC